MLRADKERVVAELTERLRGAQTVIVADYRGLTMPQIDALRGELVRHGARFAVVKNTLTRRAAEAAGADALLTLLEGPTALAFIEADGDPVAVARALADAARTTRILAIRGGVLDGRPISEADVRSLATLPPLDVLRGQVLGTIAAPLVAVVGLFTAPLRELVGLIDARIEQLEGPPGAQAAAAAPAASPVEAAEPEPEQPAAEAAADPVEAQEDQEPEEATQEE